MKKKEIDPWLAIEESFHKRSDKVRPPNSFSAREYALKHQLSLCRAQSKLKIMCDMGLLDKCYWRTSQVGSQGYLYWPKKK